MYATFHCIPDALGKGARPFHLMSKAPTSRLHVGGAPIKLADALASVHRAETSGMHVGAAPGN
jgi:hypothetical protein